MRVLVRQTITEVLYYEIQCTLKGSAPPEIATTTSSHLPHLRHTCQRVFRATKTLVESWQTVIDSREANY